MYLTKLKQYPQNNHKVTKREKYREGLFAGGKKKKNVTVTNTQFFQ